MDRALALFMSREEALDLTRKGDPMPKQFTGALVGLVWFLGYMIVAKYVVKPVATNFNVPVLKDL